MRTRKGIRIFTDNASALAKVRPQTFSGLHFLDYRCLTARGKAVIYRIESVNDVADKPALDTLLFEYYSIS